MKIRLISELSLDSQTYTYFVVISVISTVLVPAHEMNVRDLPLLLSLGLFASVCSIIVSLIVGAIVEIFPKNLLFLIQGKFLIQVLAIGVTRALLISNGLDFLEINNAQNLSGILTNSIVSTGFWLTLVAIIQREYRNFQERYRINVKEALITELHQEIYRHNAYPESVEELEKTERILKETLDDISLEFLDNEKLLKAASRVRQVIDEAIRPTSYRLWTHSNTILPRANFQDLFRATFLKLNSGSGFVATMTGLLTIVNISTNFGLVRGAFTSLVVALAIILYGISFRYLEGSGRWNSSLLRISVFLLPGLLASLVLYSFNWLFFRSESRLLIFIYALAIPLVIFAESLFRTLQQDRETIVRYLSPKSGLANRFPAKSSISSRDLANFFHNSLQSELFALSSRLESAASSMNSQDAKAALEQLQSTLNRSLSNEFADFLAKPVDRLQRSIKAWSEIMKIDLDLDSVLGHSKEVDSMIVQVVEEALANAYRHSGAARVNILGSTDSDGNVFLEISNNGKVNTTQGRGIGDAWLSHYAVKWSRENTSEGIRLSIVIPCSAQN